MPVYNMPQLSTIDFTDDDLDAGDVERREYQRLASTIDRSRVLECVLSDLDCDDSPLYDLIDQTLAEPFLPGERVRENITILATLGQDILTLVAVNVGRLIGLRMEGVAHD
jgi:hypothetical protein